MNTYRSCPTHCCPRHGCKYGLPGCPVVTKNVTPSYPDNNGCEICEMEYETLSGISAFSRRTVGTILVLDEALIREDVAGAMHACQRLLDEVENVRDHLVGLVGQDKEKELEVK